MPRSEEFRKQYLSLQEVYLDRLPKKLDAIDNDWSMLNNINWSFERLKKMQHVVRQLAGSAGSYGLKPLSKEAQILDSMIIECLTLKQIPNFELKNKMSTCIKKMYENAGIINDPPVEEHSDAHTGKKILIIDDDREQTQLLELLCKQLNCSATSINTLKEASSHIKKNIPGLILIDVVFPEGPFAGIDMIKKVYEETGFKIPVIFMSSRNDLSARIKSYRAGGLGYLTKPFGLTELKIQLDLLSNQVSHHAKVLIIDEDEQTTKQVIPFLQEQGFHCASSQKAAIIIHMLEKHTPDILLLNIDTPSINSDDILQVLRQEAKYMHLPILLITSDENHSAVNNSVAHGANGVILKPINLNIILESIQAVLKKAAIMDSIVDRVTINHTQHASVQRQFFFSMIEDNIHTSQKDSDSLLVCISLRNHDSIINSTGLTHINDVNHLIIEMINDTLSFNEKVTKISDLNFALLLSSKHAHSIESRLSKLQSNINTISVTIGRKQIELDCCCSAIYLSCDIASVDEAFNRSNNILFSIIKQDEVSIKIEHNYDKKSQLSQEKISQAIDYAFENHSLFLSYQPIIDIDGNEKMFEGFARLRDADGDTLLPDIFMPEVIRGERKAEFNRSITQTTVSDMSKLSGLEAEELEIVIKLFILEKHPTAFLSWVSNIVRSARIRGKNRLIFSISEEDALKHPNKIQELHQEMSDLTYGFMLEHAGSTPHTQDIIDTGHFEYIKLNANLIKAIRENDMQAIGLVQQFLKQNIRVIAPFIEDNSTFLSLWKIGVRYFQGYFVRKPEPSLEFDFEIEQELGDSHAFQKQY